MAEAGAQAGNAAVREHLGGVAHHQLHLFLLVHPVQADGLFQVGVHEAAVHAAHAAAGVIAGLVEEDALQGDLLVVVLADVQVAVVHDQVGRAGAGALRVNAEGVAGAVVLIAHHGGPGEGTVGVFIAAHQREGLHGVVVRGVIGRTGADAHIQMAVVLHHIPDGAAVDAVLIVVSGVVEQVLRVGDLGEALLRVGGDQDVRAALAGGRIHVHVADDQLAVVHAHAADAGGDARPVGRSVIPHVVQARVHGGERIGLRVQLIHTGQAAGAMVPHAAAEVQLAVVLHRVTEQGADAVGVLRHEQLGLAGFGVHLHQNAVAVHAVLLTPEEGAVEHGLQGLFHDVLVELVAQNALHQGQGVAHGGVTGAHIHPVAIALGGPGVALAAVTRIVIGVAFVGYHAYRTVADVIHNAVGLLGGFGGVGNLLEFVAGGPAIVRDRGRLIFGKDGQNHRREHGCAQQDGADLLRCTVQLHWHFLLQFLLMCTFLLWCA